MENSMASGGPAHVRYGHNCRPKDLLVKCPACGGMSLAQKVSERDNREDLVVDISPSWHLNDWELICTTCPKRLDGLSYDSLPTLFYSGGELGVWAWNREHLEFLAQYLGGKDVSASPYRWLSTYARGKWKANAERVCKSLDRWLRLEYL